jgi:hypothetical protein
LGGTGQAVVECCERSAKVPRYREVNGVRRAEFCGKVADDLSGSGHLLGPASYDLNGARKPIVKSAKNETCTLGCQPIHSNATRNDSRELDGAKVTDQKGWFRSDQPSVGLGRMHVLQQQRDHDAGVEIMIH